jgi:CheY-like chemotaxis protein
MENTKASAETRTEGRKRMVLLADPAPTKFNSLVSILAKSDILTEVASESNRFLERLSEEKFDLCVLNLVIGGMNPFDLIKEVRTKSANPRLKIIIVTRQIHKMTIQNTIRAGADDFIAEPFESLNLQNRIIYHLGTVTMIEPLGYEHAIPGTESEEYIKLLLDSVETLSRTQREYFHRSFLKIVQSIANLLSSNRTSLIIVDEAKNSGVVLASSDDPDFQNFPISLEKYPEILHVVHTGNVVLVEDIENNALTERIKKEVRTIQIGSIMVFPVCYQDKIVGVLHIRRPKASELPPLNVMRILQATANLMAAHANVAVIMRKIYQNYAA